MPAILTPRGGEWHALRGPVAGASRGVGRDDLQQQYTQAPERFLREAFCVGFAGPALDLDDATGDDFLDQFRIAGPGEAFAHRVERLAHDLGRGVVKRGLFDVGKGVLHPDTHRW
jgi:hypothetical protein